MERSALLTLTSTSRSRFPRLGGLLSVALALAALPAACSSEKAPDRGGLMVIVAEDGPLGIDRLDLEVKSAEATLRRSSLKLPAEAQLPTTLGIASNGNATATVHVAVSAFRGGQPIDRRDAFVDNVPVNRVAALTIILSARCSPQVFAEGTEARSRCAAGETCNPASGICFSARVDGASLPTYASGDENDASLPDGAATVDGAVDAGSDGTGGCGPDQKSCGNVCVGANDPAFGCTPAACGPCSVDTNAVMACEAGACKLTGCQAGYKVCGDKCVAMSDPTYGCGPTSCDSNGCPALDGGTGALVCNGDTCAIGTCGPGTKKCGNKCVPTDRNNGCESGNCVACTAVQACAGSPAVCSCVPDNVTACNNKACGEAVNNCGATVPCGTPCVLPATCGGGGVTNVCGCTPQPTNVTCASKACGPTLDNCGQPVWCPNTCATNKTCDTATNACIDPPSCVGLGPGQASCANSGESCCVNTVVTGGPFDRHNTPGYPASVSSFRLDRYEVTVKRYEAFKYAWVAQGWRPPAGAGKHVHLPGGLNGNEAGWETAWVTNSLMAITSNDFDTFLECSSKRTWGSVNTDRAMNCVSWWEAFAFCIWDGGFLPSAAEWNYAAAGGTDQREYPSGNYLGGSAWANICYSGNGACPGNGVMRVGFTNYGVGRFTQWDLAGNVAELTADRPAAASSTPLMPCTDCADFTSSVGRFAHGGSFDDGEGNAHTYSTKHVTMRSDQVGFRCARPN